MHCRSLRSFPSWPLAAQRPRRPKEASKRGMPRWAKLSLGGLAGLPPQTRKGHFENGFDIVYTHFMSKGKMSVIAHTNLVMSLRSTHVLETVLQICYWELACSP